MAVPFGFSVGDFIAVGSLALKIITALNDVRGSKAEYRDLISVLSSLKWALDLASMQFLQMAGRGNVNAALCNGVKHQLELCTSVMEDFLQSSKKYTESLLPIESRRSFRTEFRKISWCLFRKEDVQKLQSTLQGHVQAFMILTNAINGQYATQTNQLISDSYTMTARIERQLSAVISALQEPPRPTWDPSQPIRFEDNLGRTFSVPPVFCRTMNIFHEALKILYQDQPGQRRVVDELKENSIIQQSDWRLKVLPGGRIVMNILSENPRICNLMCPKCGTLNHKIKPVQGLLHCSHCEFEFEAAGERITELAEEEPKKQTQQMESSFTHLPSPPRTPPPQGVIRIEYLGQSIEINYTAQEGGSLNIGNISFNTAPRSTTTCQISGLNLRDVAPLPRIHINGTPINHLT